MPETIFQLSPPALLTLQTPDGAKQVKIDVYEARRALDDAGKQPSEDMRQNAILQWLAKKLGVDRTTLAENMALEFNDAIVRLVVRLNEDRQKKTEQIASSLTFTPESPATSEHGP